MENKNALTAAFSLASLEFRSRNEEAINCTRNRIYSLKIFTSYFIDVDTFYCVSDDRKYVCGRRVYTCIITRRFKGLNSSEITSLPEVKKVIYMARHFASFSSENKPHAHHKTHLHPMKVYTSGPSQFC